MASVSRQVLFLLCLAGLAGLAGCSPGARQAPSAYALERFADYLQRLERAPYGLAIRDLGAPLRGGRKIPIWFVEDPEPHDVPASVLVIGGGDVGDLDFSLSLMREILNRLAEGRHDPLVRTDYLPFLQQDNGTLRHMIKGLRHRDYDLVILHGVREASGGLALDLWSREARSEKTAQDMADHVAFTLSRLRDHGFAVATLLKDRRENFYPRAAADQTGDKKFPARLSRRIGAPVLVLRSARGEVKNIRMGEHLLAQETLTRLFMKDFSK